MSNNNIFNVSDPVHILDALWQQIEQYREDFSKVLIFLPSRRAIRKFERMIVDKIGHAVILPNLVPLGNGVEESDDEQDDDIISNQERIIILSKLLSADACIKNIKTALPVAADFVRMQDYLINQNKSIDDVDLLDLVGDTYAIHFQNKARIIDIIKKLPHDKLYAAEKVNKSVADCKQYLDDYESVIVCGSTASVVATADLMHEIANRKNGKIILSGKISGRVEDFELDTNPYNAEYKFLSGLGLNAEDVQTLDVGKNDYIDVLNTAFGNSGEHPGKKLDNCTLIECNIESEEARVATEITRRAINDKKSVLIITPDAAANQRIKTEMEKCGIDADFSSGISGKATCVGRAILNLFDDWIEKDRLGYEEKYRNANCNIFDMLNNYIEENGTKGLHPKFDIYDEDTICVWQAIKKMSDILCKNGIRLNVSDARAFVENAISNVTIRQQMNHDYSVCVLGTIESRMQNADVVILTGLNEDMFPIRGYETTWLPAKIAKEIGLPSPNKKISLMALDFMNLSCGPEVYWLRSKRSGGTLTTESRFISRVRVTVGDINNGTEILQSVLNHDNVEFNPLDYSAPVPPIDRSDVFVTDIDLLVHNPYAFYVKHILDLRPVDDYWVLPDARSFGNIVHEVIENSKDFDCESLVAQMDAGAKEKLPKDSVLFYFWHKRFCEIADYVSKELKDKVFVDTEKEGQIKIAGRNVHARADVLMSDGVLDIKTGDVPGEKSLLAGTAPQIPLEGYIMQCGGFPVKMPDPSATPVLRFLRLKKHLLKWVEHKDDKAQQMIDNTVQKVRELFGQYSGDTVAEYKYQESTGPAYHAYDDFARVDDD